MQTNKQTCHHESCRHAALPHCVLHPSTRALLRLYVVQDLVIASNDPTCQMLCLYACLCLLDDATLNVSFPFLFFSFFSCTIVCVCVRAAHACVCVCVWVGVCGGAILMAVYWILTLDAGRCTLDAGMLHIALLRVCQAKTPNCPCRAPWRRHHGFDRGASWCLLVG